MNFPYLYQQSSMDSIEIENLGDVCLQAFNDNAMEYWLVIKCSLGWVEIEEVGPFLADNNALQSGYNYHYTRMPYGEEKLIKTIDKFINNPHRAITQVFYSDNETFNDRISSLHKSE